MVPSWHPDLTHQPAVFRSLFFNCYAKMFVPFHPPPQSTICILMPFLYLVCARRISFGLHISTGAFLVLRCLCVCSAPQGKAHGPFIHVEATKDPCLKAHCVLCVSLLKFRLCLIIWHLSDILYL